MFIISISYKTNLETVDSFLQEHVEYLKNEYSKGNFILSGRKIPRSGGVILSSQKSRKDLDASIKKDPFFREDLANYEIIEISPSMASAQLEFLIE